MTKDSTKKKLHLAVSPDAVVSLESLGIEISREMQDEIERLGLNPTAAQMAEKFRESRQLFFATHAISATLQQHAKVLESVYVAKWCEESPGKFRAWFEEWKKAPDLEFVRLLIWAAQDQGVSQAAATRAKKKNQKPREWVLEQWENRADKGQKKAAFGRQYALLVKKRFGLDVIPDTICDWLSKR